MYNTMNGVNVADKLGLGPEVRELKFGSSFSSGGRGQQQGSFHSVRYDFKPASVDTSKMATLDVGPNGQVTISMPNVDGNGTTVFKGARKPYAKECVLIIDHDTGEVVLEKLTHNIQVKRTREEGGCKKSGGAISMPQVPLHTTETKKAQPPPSSFKIDPKQSSREREDHKKSIPSASSSQMHHLQPNAAKRGPGNSPMLSTQQRQSPNNGPSPGHSASPPMSFSPSAASQDTNRAAKKAQPQQVQQQPDMLSLSNFDDWLSMTPMNPPPAVKPNVEKPMVKESASPLVPPPTKPNGNGNNSNVNVSALSESSSGEDSSSSSSSGDEDSSDEMEDVPIPPLPAAVSPAQTNNVRRPQQQPPVAVAPSMPTDLLCDDLQLSESGSDSD